LFVAGDRFGIKPLARAYHFIFIPKVFLLLFGIKPGEVKGGRRGREGEGRVKGGGSERDGRRERREKGEVKGGRQKKEEEGE
jgi:hypothetical protein